MTPAFAYALRFDYREKGNRLMTTQQPDLQREQRQAIQ